MESEIDFDITVANAFISMYGKCGSLENARNIFMSMPRKDVITWSALIAGYIHCGHLEEAMQRYEMMQGNGVEPNHITFVRFKSSYNLPMCLSKKQFLTKSKMRFPFYVQ